MPISQFKLQDKQNIMKISGYASTYDIDRHNETVAEGAFNQSIEEIKSVYNSRLPMLLDHKDVIGIWYDFKQDQNGLFVTGNMYIDTPQGQEIAKAIANGMFSHMSIAATVIKSNYKNVQNKGKIRVLYELNLVEISIVSMPANMSAQIKECKILYEDAKYINTMDNSYLMHDKLLCEQSFL